MESSCNWEFSGVRKQHASTHQHSLRPSRGSQAGRDRGRQKTTRDRTENTKHQHHRKPVGAASLDTVALSSIASHQSHSPLKLYCFNTVRAKKLIKSMTHGLPSKHGLERKFKPWRKGKSQKKPATNSSLKNKLRSERRFLSKLGEDNTEARATIEARIRDLEGEINGKQQVQHEKKNAAKYHQVKFFERQKLTRFAKKVQRQLAEAIKEGNAELEQEYRDELKVIALDQLYVAHFPNDAKYLALFGSGTQRVVDDEKTKQKRNAIRKRIAESHSNGDNTKKWVNTDALEGKPVEDVLMQTNNKRKRDEDAAESTQKSLQADPRWNTELLEQKVQLVAKEEAKLSLSVDADAVESDDSNQEGSDNEISDGPIDKTNPRGEARSENKEESSSSGGKAKESNDKKKSRKEEKASEDSDSSSDSSSDDSSSSSCSSSSSSSSSSSDDDTDDEDANVKDSKTMPPNTVVTTKAVTKQQKATDDTDDFFMTSAPEEEEDAVTIAKKAFENASGLHTIDHFQGDKSKGWATQRQRPGEFKKKIQRR
eukprot:scaffold10109_cov51-Attheya_sp.AAC.7